jgi:hypothetical protein
LQRCARWSFNALDDAFHAREMPITVESSTTDLGGFANSGRPILRAVPPLCRSVHGTLCLRVGKRERYGKCSRTDNSSNERFWMKPSGDGR